MSANPVRDELQQELADKKTNKMIKKIKKAFASQKSGSAKTKSSTRPPADSTE